MANIPIRDIPGAVQTAPSPNALLPMDNGTSMEKTTVQAITDSGAPVASKSEAEAGTDNAKRMTALRVKESIAAEVGQTIASAAQGSKADSAVQPSRAITAGTGLVGGGDLSADRSFALSSTALASLALADTAVQPARAITAGTGLTGGGSLAADRIISLSTATQASLALANSAVQPTITISAGNGLTGGGTLAANRTIALSSASIASLALADSAVQPSRTISAGTGLTGGGDLSANRTISLNASSIASLALADSAVQPTRTISTGMGLAGGGSLATDRTISLSPGTVSSLGKADTAVQPSRTITAGTGLTGGGDLSVNRTISLNSATQASLALADSAVQPGDAELLPAGGTAGQVLAKASGDDYDVEWVTSEAATAVSYGPQSLTSAQKSQARANIGVNFIPCKNKLLNPLFQVNQRGVSGTVSVNPTVYGHDRWKGGAAGSAYTFSTSNGVTTVTITAGMLRQVVEAAMIAGETGTYVLTWEGTATGRINGGAFGTSGNVSASLDGSSDVIIDFQGGTVRKPMLALAEITDFTCLPPALDMLACQRYYRHITVCAASNMGDTGAFRFSQSYSPPMRTTPTVSVFSSDPSSMVNVSDVAIGPRGTDSLLVQCTPTVVGRFYLDFYTFAMSAEL